MPAVKLIEIGPPVAAISSAVLVINSTFATEAIEASASPRKPSVVTLSSSSGQTVASARAEMDAIIGPLITEGLVIRRAPEGGWSVGDQKTGDLRWGDADNYVGGDTADSVSLSELAWRNAVQAASGRTAVGTDTSTLNTVTLGADGTETFASESTGSLSTPRWYSTGVTLPTGDLGDGPWPVQPQA